jgi:hypothetical protein
MADIIQDLIMLSKACESGPNDDGHLIGRAVDEIVHLRAALVSFIQCAPSGIAEKIIDGDGALEPFRKYLRETKA